MESSLILFYGCTNIFLEHLAGWGSAWTARDLEHVSITTLFIGGGLVSFALALTAFPCWLITFVQCGVLIEYVRVKGLSVRNTGQPKRSAPHCANGMADEQPQHEPSGVSLNPMPSLVIFLLGGTMASHEQASMVSTMVHKQWGNLLGAASVARLLTYTIMYLKPPTSTWPSRPPTELLSSFCLISGGMLFMASVRLVPRIFPRSSFADTRISSLATRLTE